MVSFAVVGYPAKGKSTSIFPNEKAGIKGLPPEQTIYISCAGPAKRIQFANWRNVFKADKKISEGGQYASMNNPIMIADMIKYVSVNRKEIKYIVIDDANLVMADKVLGRYNNVKKSVSKMDRDDWDSLGVTTYQMFKVLDEIVLSAELNRPDLFVIYTFHLTSKENYDVGMIKHSISTSGQMIEKHKPIASMFDIILVSNTHFDVIKNETTYVFELKQFGDTPARSPIGMFDDIPEVAPGKIPNDLGKVVDAICKFDGIIISK